MTLSSPNRMVTRCFRSLETLLGEIEAMESSDLQKDKISLLLILAINTVETFINVYFRVLIEQDQYSDSKEMVLSDLSHDNGSNALGLKSKLNNWPPKVLKKSVNWSSGVGAEFDKLRETRNKLMHFTSSHETFSHGQVSVNGLTDTSVFDNLSVNDAFNAYHVTFGFIEYILRIAGTDIEQLPHAMHHWAGIVPQMEP